MSRIGNEPIQFDPKVTVEVSGSTVNVKGPKGELKVEAPGYLSVSIEDSTITVARKADDKLAKSMHGTVRSLISNAIEGVMEGYSKRLEIHGVGFRVAQSGKNISLSLGLNHPIEVQAIEGTELTVENETTILISGIDKQKVGEMAAYIRELKKPEPYKGKGIRYEGEYVRRKSAKTASKA